MTSSFNGSPDGRALNPGNAGQHRIITFFQGAQTLSPICKGWFFAEAETKVQLSLVQMWTRLQSVDLPFVRNNCMSLDCIPFVSGSFWNQIFAIIQCACVCLCFGYFGCFDGSAICISPKFWSQKYSAIGLEQENQEQQHGSLPLTPALLSECHLSTQENRPDNQSKLRVSILCKRYCKGQDQNTKHSYFQYRENRGVFFSFFKEKSGRTGMICS